MQKIWKFSPFFPVLDVVMIGDDVRDDVNGGINYGLMVCNDYQGLIYTIHTAISGWNLLWVLFWIEQFYPVLIKPSKVTFRHQKNFDYRAVLSRLENTDLEMIYLRIRESLKFLFSWKHVVISSIIFITGLSSQDWKIPIWRWSPSDWRRIVQFFKFCWSSK